MDETSLRTTGCVFASEVGYLQGALVVTVTDTDHWRRAKACKHSTISCAETRKQAFSRHSTKQARSIPTARWRRKIRKANPDYHSRFFSPHCSTKECRSACSTRLYGIAARHRIPTYRDNPIAFSITKYSSHRRHVTHCLETTPRPRILRTSFPVEIRGFSEFIPRNRHSRRVQNDLCPLPPTHTTIHTCPGQNITIQLCNSRGKSLAVDGTNIENRDAGALRPTDGCRGDKAGALEEPVRHVRLSCHLRAHSLHFPPRCRYPLLTLSDDLRCAELDPLGIHGLQGVFQLLRCLGDVRPVLGEARIVC